MVSLQRIGKRSVKSFLVPLAAALASLVLVLTLDLRAYGQVNKASLGGTVLDPSGAAIPQANVTVTNKNTSHADSTTTNAAGEFLFPALDPGPYNVSVVKSGFATYLQEALTLTVNQAAQLAITLKLGQATQEITVSGAAGLVLNTREATVGQLVDQDRIVDLPLNGRESNELMFLSAGTVNTTTHYCGFNCFGGVYPSEQNQAVNGAGPGSVNFTMNGVGHNDTYLNMNLPFPNPDAVQEFKLVKDNLSAEYGRSASGVVNIVTKSGSNKFHGDAFEFLRNGDLNARNYFAPKQDTLKRNQFGGGIGGPVIKDKVFFFGNYQGTRITQASQGQVEYVPTAAERSGNFSVDTQQLTNPLTGVAFPGNQIPTTDFEAPSTYFLSKIPLPQGPGSQLTYSAAASRPNQNEFTTRGDWDYKRNLLTATYFFGDFLETPVTAPANNILAADSSGNKTRVQGLAMSNTFTVTPNLLIFGSFAYNRQTGGSLSSAPFSFADAGVKIAPSSIPPGELVVSVGGDFSVNTNHPGTFDRSDINFEGRVSLIKGKHQIDAGIEEVRLKNYIANTFTEAGQFSFFGSFSGDNLADLLLGRPSSFLQGGGEWKDLIGWQDGVFFNDTWKPSKRLSLTLGIRWDPYYPYTEQEGRVASFQPQQVSLRYPNAPPGLVFGGINHDPACPTAACIYTQEKNFSPRFGVAYRLTEDAKTVLRLGYGIYYSAVDADDQTAHFDAPFAPVFEYTGSTLDFTDPYGSQGVPNPFPARFGGTNVIPGSNVTFELPTALQVDNPHMHVPYLQTYTGAIERQLESWTLRIAYVGNKGTHMGTTFQGFPELNPAIYIPGTAPNGTPLSTTANTQQRRRYQAFTNITEISDRNGTSKYNGLQINAEKRYTKGLSVLANYTYSHNIDDFGYSDPFDREIDRSSSGDDLRHNFNFSGIWSLPNSDLSGLRGHLRNGWQLTSIISWHDGFNFTVDSGVDNSLSGHGGDRADFVKTGTPFTRTGSSHAQQVAEFFDTSFFGPNAIGTYGTTGRSILRGPRFFDTDLGVLKNTKINERFSTQFRAEFFNAFNDVNFGYPDSTLTDTAFGKITSALDPRILQFALKFIF